MDEHTNIKSNNQVVYMQVGLIMNGVLKYFFKKSYYSYMNRNNKS